MLSEKILHTKKILRLHSETLCIIFCVRGDNMDMRNYKNLKNRAAQALFTITALSLAITACSPPPRVTVLRGPTDPSEAFVNHGFSRTVNTAAFEGLAYDEWSLECEPLARRAQTLLIYMNGSDLESDTAAGTDDLKELMLSGVDETSVNIVIFTGGANRWHTKAVPSNECAVSVLRGGKISQIATLGQRDMGNTGTLSSFISFGLECFPSDRTSLILWDHGGGSIAGYGADENFDMSTLTLPELEYAFEKAGLAENRLELMGFDACLMASVEMAVVAARYSDYLLASESVEPGDGWDYRTVSALSNGATGWEFGIAICDSFSEFYSNSREEFTLSLVRTEDAENVMGALGLLAGAAKATLEVGGFRQLSLSRRSTKAFGGGTPLDEPCDMIDILDFTRALEASFPEEAHLVRSALAKAVLYSVYRSDTALGGLSVYHMSGRGDIGRALDVYKGLNMSKTYTEYLTAFAGALRSFGAEPAPAEKPLHTRLLGGRTAMYEVSATCDGAVYAVSVNVNGELAELLIYRPSGITEYEAAAGELDELLGYRKRDGLLVQKGYDELLPEDEIVLLFSDGGEYRKLSYF